MNGSEIWNVAWCVRAEYILNYHRFDLVYIKVTAILRVDSNRRQHRRKWSCRSVRTGHRRFVHSLLRRVRIRPGWLPPSTTNLGAVAQVATDEPPFFYHCKWIVHVSSLSYLGSGAASMLQQRPRSSRQHQPSFYRPSYHYLIINIFGWIALSNISEIC